MPNLDLALSILGINEIHAGINKCRTTLIEELGIL
jgi:hypothetical protein